MKGADPMPPTATPTPTATSVPVTHVTRHETTVAADPDTVFAVIADAGSWPQVFGPTVHAEVVEETGSEQILRIWAFANGEVRNWTSRRALYRAQRRISFRQMVSSAPVASMGGDWQVEAAPDGGSHVVLLHDFTAVDNDPEAVAWIGQAVDRNSGDELAALGRATAVDENGVPLRFTFHDSVHIDGDADDVFAFLDRADQWPVRLPHVDSLQLREEGNVQHMEMGTRAPDGSVHTTTSVRVSFAERGLIVYKQVRTPPVMAGHTGRWTVEPDGDGVRATSWHTVTLDLDGVRSVLGPDATAEQAREKVRHALSTNSSTTLACAKAFAESRRQG